MLVIDDEESSRYLAEHMLEPSGCTVVDAATAREGLVQVRQVRPAAVFLDLGLPDLISASYRAASQAQEWQTAGASAFLEQPVSADELLRTLDSLLDSPGAPDS